MAKKPVVEQLRHALSAVLTGASDSLETSSVSSTVETSRALLSSLRDGSVDDAARSEIMLAVRKFWNSLGRQKGIGRFTSPIHHLDARSLAVDIFTFLLSSYDSFVARETLLLVHVTFAEELLAAKIFNRSWDVCKQSRKLMVWSDGTEMTLPKWESLVLRLLRCCAETLWVGFAELGFSSRNMFAQLSTLVQEIPDAFRTNAVLPLHVFIPKYLASTPQRVEDALSWLETLRLAVPTADELSTFARTRAVCLCEKGEVEAAFALLDPQTPSMVDSFAAAGFRLALALKACIRGHLPAETVIGATAAILKSSDIDYKQKTFSVSLLLNHGDQCPQFVAEGIHMFSSLTASLCERYAPALVQLFEKRYEVAFPKNDEQGTSDGITPLLMVSANLCESKYKRHGDFAVVLEFARAVLPLMDSLTLSERSEADFAEHVCHLCSVLNVAAADQFETSSFAGAAALWTACLQFAKHLPPDHSDGIRAREVGRLHRCLALNAMRTDDLVGARMHADDALSVDGQSERSLYVDFSVALASKDFQTASASLARILAMSPQPSAEFLFVIARVAYESQQFSMTLSALETARGVLGQSLASREDLTHVVLRNIVSCTLRHSRVGISTCADNTEGSDDSHCPNQVVLRCVRQASLLSLSDELAVWWWNVGWNACLTVFHFLTRSHRDSTSGTAPAGTRSDVGGFLCNALDTLSLGSFASCPVTPARRCGALYLAILVHVDNGGSRQIPHLGLLRDLMAKCSDVLPDSRAGDASFVELVKSPRFSALLSLAELQCCPTNRILLKLVESSPDLTASDFEATAWRVRSTNRVLAQRLLLRGMCIIIPKRDPRRTPRTEDAIRAARMLRVAVGLRGDNDLSIAPEVIRIVQACGSGFPSLEMEWLVAEFWNAGAAFLTSRSAAVAIDWLGAAINIAEAAQPPHPQVTVMRADLERLRSTGPAAVAVRSLLA
eukprot:TRINITY_DN4495_c0_g1_i1.p1 TRINITY_DN4495_c0_g1~~TRINITY_DN4495_c0_g1_i1.p1  ORF type:complete len:956 (+),score=15.94 TRINITY_DN4495_c0_g1_i1:69-2936(+)